MVMLELRESFSDLAESYGLNLQELQNIVSVSTKDHLSYTDGRMAASCEALFRRYDDDCNGLVDFFEFLASLGLVSAMSVEEKAMYIFDVFHFGKPGKLTVSEVTLALRTSVSGLAKISGLERPVDTVIDQVVLAAFEYGSEPQKKFDEQSTVIKEHFVQFFMSSPEVSSWVNFFADSDKVETLHLRRVKDSKRQPVMV